MASSFTFAVIGAGIEGAATAYYLAKNGFKTVLLEQFRLGHTRGSSHGSSRITRKSYDHPNYVQMMKRAYNMWDELERECGEKLFKKTGFLCIGATDGEEINKYANAMSVNGLPYELLSNEDIAKRYPLKYDAKWSGLYDPDGGLLKADRCLHAFHEQFIKYGGVIKDGDAVSSIKSTGERVQIDAASGAQYQCSGVVACVGTWAKTFISDHLDLKLPLQPLTVKACYWKAEKKGLYSSNNFPCIFVRDECDNGNVLYGLPSDEYPDLLKFFSHSGVPINHPDERDSVDASKYIDIPGRHIKEHFGFVQDKPAIVETCMYTVTPDENFVLDIHPKYKNVVIGAGFSGHGFKMAPVVGEILASLLLGRSIAFDMTMFQMGRFDGDTPTATKL